MLCYYRESKVPKKSTVGYQYRYEFKCERYSTLLITSVMLVYWLGSNYNEVLAGHDVKLVSPSYQSHPTALRWSI